MKFFQSRTAAILIAVVLMAASLVIGGKLSLAPQRAEVEAVFTEASDGSGKGIQYDLDERVAEAYNLIAVAKRYLNADDTLITAVSDAISAIVMAKGPSDKYDANMQLTSACSALYTKLASMQLSASDQEYNEGIKAELNSHNQIIGHSDYNELASEFNIMLAKFPTSIIGSLSGVHMLELFE